MSNNGRDVNTCGWNVILCLTSGEIIRKSGTIKMINIMRGNRAIVL